MQNTTKAHRDECKFSTLQNSYDESCECPDASEIEDEHEQCAYCNRDVAHVTPELSDDRGWEKVAAQHSGNCEWVLTRAFRDIDSPHMPKSFG